MQGCKKGEAAVANQHQQTLYLIVLLSHFVMPAFLGVAVVRRSVAAKCVQLCPMCCPKPLVIC